MSSSKRLVCNIMITSYVPSSASFASKSLFLEIHQRCNLPLHGLRCELCRCSSCICLVYDSLCGGSPILHSIIFDAQLLSDTEHYIMPSQWFVVATSPSLLASARTYMMWLRPQPAYGRCTRLSPHSIIRCHKSRPVPCGLLTHFGSKHS